MGKLNYVKGSKPQVECILCSVKNNDPRVTALKVYQEKNLFISLNLYPYNPGHLMVIPTRHVESFEQLSDHERNRIFEVVIQCQKMLRTLFSPAGFNVGYNEGDFSGASIKHVHVHVVPRYDKELGFIDIIGNGRIVVEQSDQVLKKVLGVVDTFIQPPEG
jgi:ATP adenylyltransferase